MNTKMNLVMKKEIELQNLMESSKIRPNKFKSIRINVLFNECNNLWKEIRKESKYGR